MTPTNALVGLLLTVAAVMKEWGWRGVSMFALIVALLAIGMIYAKPPLIPLPGDRTVAFEPGSDFDVAKWCKDVAETVKLDPVPDAAAVRYVAARGAETVEWTVNPSGDADRYYRDASGVQRHEGVLVSEAARKCMTTAR